MRYILHDKIFAIAEVEGRLYMADSKTSTTVTIEEYRDKNKEIGLYLEKEFFIKDSSRKIFLLRSNVDHVNFYILGDRIM